MSNVSRVDAMSGFRELPLETALPSAQVFRFRLSRRVLSGRSSAAYGPAALENLRSLQRGFRLRASRHSQSAGHGVHSPDVRQSAVICASEMVYIAVYRRESPEHQRPWDHRDDLPVSDYATSATVSPAQSPAAESQGRCTTGRFLAVSASLSTLPVSLTPIVRLGTMRSD